MPCKGLLFIHGFVSQCVRLLNKVCVLVVCMYRIAVEILMDFYIRGFANVFIFYVNKYLHIILTVPWKS